MQPMQLQPNTQTPRTALPLAGGTGGYIGQQLDPAQTINLYNAAIPGIDEPALVAIPGSQTVFTNPNGENTRGIFETGNLLFAVFSNEVVVYTNDLNTFDTFTINTSSGPVNFAANNNKQVMLVDGVDGWVYDFGSTPTFTQITDTVFTSFNNPLDIDYLYGHIFVVFGSGNAWIISNFEDATTYDALNQANMTSAGNQTLTGVRVVAARIYFFGNTITEIWYGTGQVSTFPFAIDNNSTIQWGCVSNATIAAGTIQVKSMYRIFPDIEDVMVWLGRQQHGSPKVLISSMGQTSVISDEATEYKIQNLPTITDAIGFLNTINGHTFYTLTFPTGHLTLVYDFDMKLWHEQQMIDGNEYFASCHAMFNHQHYIGQLNAPKLSELNDNYTSNDNEAIHCVRTTPIFSLPSYERLSIPRVDLDMRKGTGAKTTTQISGTEYDTFNIDPKIYLSHSMNGGATFSESRPVESGAVGQTDWKVLWTGFPVSQRHNFKFETFNATKTILLGASIQFQNMGY